MIPDINVWGTFNSSVVVILNEVKDLSFDLGVLDHVGTDNAGVSHFK
jgi:hypothetical protein